MQQDQYLLWQEDFLQKKGLIFNFSKVSSSLELFICINYKNFRSYYITRQCYLEVSSLSTPPYHRHAQLFTFISQFYYFFQVFFPYGLGLFWKIFIYKVSCSFLNGGFTKHVFLCFVSNKLCYNCSWNAVISITWSIDSFKFYSLYI